MFFSIQLLHSQITLVQRELAIVTGISLALTFCGNMANNCNLEVFLIVWDQEGVQALKKLIFLFSIFNVCFSSLLFSELLIRLFYLLLLFCWWWFLGWRDYSVVGLFLSVCLFSLWISWLNLCMGKIQEAIIPKLNKWIPLEK